MSDRTSSSTSSEFCQCETPKKLKDSKLYQKAEKYWWSRLGSLPPAPELPLAKNPNSLEKPQFKALYGKLDALSWSRLKEKGTQEKLTPSGILLSAFAEVLRIWSKQVHFTINLTFFECFPLHPQVNDIVGDFTSLVLLEVNNSAQKTFLDRSRHLQRQLWSDLEHSSVSAIQVLRERARQQRLIPQAAMPVVFTSVLPHKTEGKKPPVMWMGEVVHSITQTPQVWLDNIVSEEAGELKIRWNFVEELFPVGLIEQMFESYCSVLQQLATDSASWQYSKAEIADKLVAQRLINTTQAQIPSTNLYSLFAQQVPQRLNHQAIVAPNCTLSYGELFHRANQIGHRLRQLGASRNQLVAVVMEKDSEQIVSVLGILASGAAYLPVEAGVAQERLWYLLEQGEVEFVLTQSWVDQQLVWPENIQRLCIDDETLWETNHQPLEPLQQPTDLAYVIYTSGSTGLPKGVSIDHRGAVNTILDINQRFGVNWEDRVLALSSLSFDLSVYDIFGTLAAGGTIVLPEVSKTKDPSHWANLIEREKITIWNSVPALMKLLVEYVTNRPEISLCSLRLVLLSGDWIPVTLPNQIKALADGIQVISLGGATEASIWSILYPIEQVDSTWESIPYGKPMVNQEVYVLNQDLALCPVWVPGQLYIGGIGLSLGYWRDSLLTEKSFITHPRTGERLYRTGDVGRYLPDGNIEFIGREDFQVKIQGNRIELAEIEAALVQNQKVDTAVVNAVGDVRGEKRLVAYVVLSSQGKISHPESEFQPFLQGKLPDYMIPSSFMILERLPLTANGKIDRKALPVPPPPRTELVESSNGTVQTNLSTQIAQLVAMVLEVQEVAPQANWLNLGATSVDMIRIANRLDNELGFRPTMDELYRQPRAIAIANLYSKHQQQKLVTKPTDSKIEAHFPIILDPEERKAFKNSQPGLRRDENRASLALVIPNNNEVYQERYSARQFIREPIAKEHFSQFLDCLRQIQLDENSKYLYPSAGGLYPVQTYLHIKLGRVAGVGAGTYYYHPVNHRLVELSEAEELDATIHERLVNRPIYDSAAFSVFLIADMRAIAPIYGNLARDFCLIEAGAMVQLIDLLQKSHKKGIKRLA